MAEEDWVHFFGLLILILCCYHVFQSNGSPGSFYILGIALIFVRQLDKHFGR